MQNRLDEPAKGRPTGRRIVTQAELQSTAGLTGILKGLERGRVLATFKGAVAALGFPRWVRDMIDLLFRYSRNMDWQAGWARIVWPSNEELCHHLELSLDGIKKRIRKLIDLGLIRAIDIGTGKRWGRRCSQTQRILQSCGFDLSPVGERMPEFMAASAEYEARRQEAKALRAQCSAWSRRVLSMTDHGNTHGLEGGEWIVWAAEAKTLAQTAKGITDPIRLISVEARLKALHYRVIDALEAAALPVDCVIKAPQGSQSGTLITTTSEKLIAKAIAPAGSGPAHKEGGVAGTLDSLTSTCRRAEGAKEAALFRGFPVTPQVLLHLVPALRDWVNNSVPDWSEISTACNHLRQHMGISNHLYAQTRLVLGEQGAAVALGTIAVKHQAKLVQNPGGYLRRMLEKQHTGELRLDRTLYGLAEASGRPKPA